MIRAEKGISGVIAKLKTTVTEYKAEITKLKTPLAQETEKTMKRKECWQTQENVSMNSKKQRNIVTSRTVHNNTHEGAL